MKAILTGILSEIGNILIKIIFVAIIIILSFITAYHLIFWLLGDESNHGGPFVIFLVIFFAVGIWYKRWQSRLLYPPISQEEYQSPWATAEEVDQYNKVDYKSMSGLFVGDPIFRNADGHIITVAAPGAGKSAGLLIPTLLLEPNASFVVNDPKGELCCVTARSQNEYGQRVFIFDPWDEQKSMKATHGIPASGINPFDFIRSNMEELADNCKMIAEILIPENPHVKDPFWNERAKTLIKLVMMHIMTDCEEDEQNFWTLYKMLRYTGKDWLGLVIDMKNNDAVGGLIQIGIGEFSEFEEGGSVITGIKSSAQNATSIFESTRVREALSSTGFNPYDLADGDCTLYVVIPERYMVSHAALMKMIVAICLKAVNARPNKSVNFILDEFPMLGKMADIQTAFAFGRGQGITVWAIAQSLSQIKSIYGQEGMEALIGSSHLLQAFNVRDQFTQQYISKALGEVEEIQSSQGESTDHKGQRSSSTNYSKQKKPVMTPEEVGNTDLIMNKGHGIRYVCYKRPYYKNMFEELTGNESWLTGEQKKMIKQRKLPQDKLYEYFMKHADTPTRFRG